MDGMDGFNGFHLNKQALVDQQVESEQFFALKLLIPNDYTVLILDRDLCRRSGHSGRQQRAGA